VEGAGVICLPLGSTASSQAEQHAFREAVRKGVIVVCAAGNSGHDEPVYPAAYPGCIAMAAVDKENQLAAFSNFGEWVTAAAPGVEVPVAVGKDHFENWSGTSMACGIGAGIAALLLKKNPKLTGTAIQETLRSIGPRVFRSDGVELAPHNLHVLDALAAVQRAEELAAKRKAAKK